MHKPARGPSLLPLAERAQWSEAAVGHNIQQVDELGRQRMLIYNLRSSNYNCSTHLMSSL